MSDEPTATRAVTVTCRTDGCGNAGAEITVDVPLEPATPLVVCGACSSPIAEVRDG